MILIVSFFEFGQSGFYLGYIFLRFLFNKSKEAKRKEFFPENFMIKEFLSF